MRRTNLYFTEMSAERLHQREGLAAAELVKRAVDVFLPWDDPTSTLQQTPAPNKEGPFIPWINRRGFLGRFL